MSKYVSKKPDQKGFVDFSAEENGTWQILIERQLEIIQDRACDEFITGLEKLNLPLDRVPQCYEVSEVLKNTTGWSVQPVAAMIPLKEFFRLLANRQFPAATFIRVREELDYLQEPDIFHEYFGHCPLLTNQAYADFVQWYGETALEADRQIQSLLGRVFWFTIEFGLMNTAKGIRIYGGGILSSNKETVYALESTVPARIPFDLDTALATPYRYDVIQDKYFVINEIADLYQIKRSNIMEMARKILNKPDPENDFIVC